MLKSVDFLQKFMQVLMAALTFACRMLKCLTALHPKGRIRIQEKYMYSDPSTGSVEEKDTKDP